MEKKFIFLFFSLNALNIRQEVYAVKLVYTLTRRESVDCVLLVTIFLQGEETEKEITSSGSIISHSKTIVLHTIAHWNYEKITGRLHHLAVRTLHHICPFDGDGVAAHVKCMIS